MSLIFPHSRSRAGTHLLAGGVHKIRLRGMRKQRYYLAVPECRQTDHVIVLVHGISRNVQWLIESFWPLVRERRIALVAPLFTESSHKDFQRLGRSGQGPRADLAVNAILAEVSGLTGWSASKAFFFGHSGGAQFVQRYLFAHPQRVIRAALSAAGWYTFPVDNKYPFGIRETTDLPGVHFEPQRFLRIPTAVFIGLEDTVRDESLNCSRRIDQLQGANRLERARNWVDAMEQASHSHGLAPCVKLIEVPGVSHDYAKAVKAGQLNQQAFAWLLSD